MGVGADVARFATPSRQRSRRLEALLSGLDVRRDVGRGLRRRPRADRPGRRVERRRRATSRAAIAERRRRTVTAEPAARSSMADRGEMVQVLQNLLGNAIKYHGERRAPRVHAEAVRRGGELGDRRSPTTARASTRAITTASSSCSSACTATSEVEGTGMGLRDLQEDRRAPRRPRSGSTSRAGDGRAASRFALPARARARRSRPEAVRVRRRRPLARPSTGRVA